LDSGRIDCRPAVGDRAGAACLTNRRQAIKDQKNCGIPGDSETEPPHFECDHRHRREFSF
jgi:hypothetical protein